MNPTRRRILTFIRDFEQEFGRTPNVSEIATGLTMKRETVTDNLRKMEMLRYVVMTRDSYTDGYAYRIVRYRLPGEAVV